MSREISLPLNLEMAPTAEMQEIAFRHLPHAACIVPERREERTTEGGIDAAGQFDRLVSVVGSLVKANIRVSLFVEPELPQIEAARALGAPVIELHTGAYCDAALSGQDARPEQDRLTRGARFAAEAGLEVHAGHGLTFDTVAPVAALPQVVELNIGHFLVGEAIFVGFEASIREMRRLMDAARGTR